ncbi:hypothetical protein JD969_20745 [Planctomycetota bacterium]|nr:hypothetical protein JD969_20745 [Planctomycetota bacterium]
MPFMQLYTLAQDATSDTQPWWHVLIQGSFGLTVLFIFLTAVIGVIINQRKRDKCLKHMDDYHVTYIDNKGTVTWGDLAVFSKGLEINYDEQYLTRDQLIKASSLIYSTDLTNCNAICRVTSALTNKELQLRKKQIKKAFNPNIIRRTLRGFRNILNTLKDAFSKALSLLLGQLSKASPKGALTSQKGGIDQIGQMVLGVAGNSYEPLLERHIGRPVIMQTKFKTGDKEIISEFPGFLADYTDKYISLFNKSHEPIDSQELDINENISLPGCDIEFTKERLKLTPTGKEIIVVNWIQTSKRVISMGVAVTPTATLELSHDQSSSIKLSIERTRRIDMICPRQNATIYYGGDRIVAKQSLKDGIAPEVIADKIIK